MFSESWLIFQNDTMLLKQQDAKFSIPVQDDISLFKPYLQRSHLIQHVDPVSYYAAELADDFAIPPRFIAVTLRKAFALLSEDWFKVVIKAYSVVNWDRNHQFCGRCGSKTSHDTASFERRCLGCGMAFYPRISPSIIVLIKKDDHLLMARSPHFVPGAYGLIAGFVEVGETLEETIHREVMEEVQIKVKNIQYFGSQPWPFPDSLMIGFYADYESGEIVIDNKEIEAAGWYRYDNLPGRPSVSISIAKRLIDHFVQEQTQRFAAKE